MCNKVIQAFSVMLGHKRSATVSNRNSQLARCAYRGDVGVKIQIEILDGFQLCTGNKTTPDDIIPDDVMPDKNKLRCCHVLSLE